MSTAPSTEYAGSASWTVSPASADDPRTTYNPRLSLLNECLAMIKFAAGQGSRLPTRPLAVVEAARLASMDASRPAPTLEAIGTAHASLAAVVGPANPNTILLLEDEQAAGFMRHFGSICYARRLWMAAFVVFVVFLVSLGRSISEPSNETRQLVLTAVASLVGSIFYVLFTANRQLRAGTFDRRQEGNLTALIVLGVLAGTALAYLIVSPGSGEGSPEVETEIIVTRPLLGLLGGFAAKGVYRIMQRLVTTVETLVGGSAEDLLAAQQRELSARSALRATQVRLGLVVRLSELRDAVAPTDPGTAALLQAEVDRLLGPDPEA